MEPRIRRALETERTIDITTTGRTTGRPRRIEMWFHNLDGRLYLTGTPGTRDWYANLQVHPAFTFHLKGAVRADLPARATAIVDPAAAPDHPRRASSTGWAARRTSRRGSARARWSRSRSCEPAETGEPRPADPRPAGLTVADRRRG